ncbi:hypothetical protein GF360_02415 [candidate division WWE3 bacterium]|nr:hypothetical protein [candidate division WWE3 bacterium]
MDKREIGVTSMAFFPWVLLPGGLLLVNRWSRKAGYDFLQPVPSRGIFPFVLRRIPADRIPHTQGSWHPRPGRPLMAVARQFGLVGDEWPLPEDWIVFASARLVECRLKLFQRNFPDVRRVGHSWGDPLLEVNPDLLTSAGEQPALGDLLDYPGDLVIDLWHVRREGWQGQAPLTSEPVEFFQQLLFSGKVVLVHFQPARDGAELGRFLRGEPTVLDELLALLRLYPRIPLVVELAPPSTAPASWMFPRSAIQGLIQVRQRIEEVLT